MTVIGFSFQQALMDDHGHGDGSHSHEHSHSADAHAGHGSDALKGLCVVIGIFLFFIGEKLMQLKRSLKEKKVRLKNTHANKLKYFLNFINL